MRDKMKTVRWALSKQRCNWVDWHASGTQLPTNQRPFIYWALVI